jgi:hypothetical protein
VLGFVGSTSYQLARLEDDAAGLVRAHALLEEAVAANPIFNNFTVFATASTTPRGSPGYARVLELARDLITLGPSATCIVDQPEICGSAGLAPQSLSGSLVLVGDVFAKGGEEANALTAYTLAKFFGTATAWPFMPLLDERLADLPGRMARYANEDPADDPAFIGSREENCVSCHAD